MKLSSDWTASDGFNLNDGVEVCSEVPSQLPDLLLENKSFVLLPNEKSVGLPCSLTLCSAPCGTANSAVLAPLQVMTSITLVSEARLVEVFVGDHEEYFKSFNGEVLQNFDDSIVCRIDINLLKPRKKVKLLLRNLFDAASVMVYGVFTKIEELEPGCSNNSSFPRFSSSHLNSLLADRSLNLSENALALKKLVEQYNDNVGSSAAASFSNIMPLIGMSFASTRTSMKPRHLDPSDERQQNGIHGAGACGGKSFHASSVPNVQENGNYVSEGKDLQKINSNLSSTNGHKGSPTTSEQVKGLPDHDMKKSNHEAANAEFLSNALKNQLNLNLNNSMNFDSAQLLQQFFKQKSSNFNDNIEKSVLSVVTLTGKKSGKLSDESSVSSVKLALPNAVNGAQTVRCEQLSESDNYEASLSNASEAMQSVQCFSRAVTSENESSLIKPPLDKSADEKRSFEEPCQNELPVEKSSTDGPAGSVASLDISSVEKPSHNGSLVNKPPSCNLREDTAIAPGRVACLSECSCHQLEKILDDKFEKFEAKIESLIDRKLDECVTQILNVLQLNVSGNSSLGRI